MIKNTMTISIAGLKEYNLYLIKRLRELDDMYMDLYHPQMYPSVKSFHDDVRSLIETLEELFRQVEKSSLYFIGYREKLLDYANFVESAMRIVIESLSEDDKIPAPLKKISVFERKAKLKQILI